MAAQPVSGFDLPPAIAGTATAGHRRAGELGAPRIRPRWQRRQGRACARRTSDCARRAPSLRRPCARCARCRRAQMRFNRQRRHSPANLRLHRSCLKPNAVGEQRVPAKAAAPGTCSLASGGVSDARATAIGSPGLAGLCAAIRHRGRADHAPLAVAWRRLAEQCCKALQANACVLPRADPRPPAGRPGLGRWRAVARKGNANCGPSGC